MFNRYWHFGWVSPKGYVKHIWACHFTYWKNMVWQIMIFGFYIGSTTHKSILTFCKKDCKYLYPSEHAQYFGHHYCRKYKKQVKHLGYHPKIVSVNMCKIAIWHGEK